MSEECKQKEFTTWELLTSPEFYKSALAIIGLITIINIAFKR